jgi:hypothetical protein
MEKALRQGNGPEADVRSKLAGDLAANACTTILYKDGNPNKGIIMGRNMDWPAFGDGGANSLVIVWKAGNSNVKDVAALSVPGLIGVITGWNKDGLALAMNVCPGETRTVRGMPAIFTNRQLLERFNKVEEVNIATQSNEQDAKSESSRPLGAYHLTIADADNDGMCISFHNNNDKDYRREAITNQALTVLNWPYPAEVGGSFNSEERNVILKEYFTKANSSATELDSHMLVQNIMKLRPYISSWITMHSLTFMPIQNRMTLSVGNGYAPLGTYQDVTMREFFEEQQKLEPLPEL